MENIGLENIDHYMGESCQCNMCKELSVEKEKWHQSRKNCNRRVIGCSCLSCQKSNDYKRQYMTLFYRRSIIIELEYIHQNIKFDIDKVKKAINEEQDLEKLSEYYLSTPIREIIKLLS